MRRRWLTIFLVLIAVVGAGWLAWRWEIQTVNVVMVNASGLPATFSWQPQLFAGEETVPLGGCESKSVTLRAGERWRLDHDRLQMNSAAIEVPPFTTGVAIEIWIDADGSSRYVPPYAVDQPVPAPQPDCAT